MTTTNFFHQDIKFDDSYNILKTLKSSTINNQVTIEILEGENKEQKTPCIVKKLSFNSIDGANDCYFDLWKISQFSHKNILQQEKIYIEPSEKTNTPSFVYIITKNYTTDLETYLSSRAKEKQYIEQDVLFDYVCNLTEALAFLHEKEYVLKIGLLKAENICVVENGASLQLDIRQYIVGNQTESALLPPEYQSQAQNTKAGDIFCLGVVFFQIATLLSRNACEDIFKNDKELGDIKQKLQDANCNKRIQEIILKMLLPNPTKRPSANDILNKVLKLQSPRNYPKNRRKSVILNLLKKENFNIELDKLQQETTTVTSPRSTLTSPRSPHSPKLTSPRQRRDKRQSVRDFFENLISNKRESAPAMMNRRSIREILGSLILSQPGTTNDKPGTVLFRRRSKSKIEGKGVSVTRRLFEKIAHKKPKEDFEKRQSLNILSNRMLLKMDDAFLTISPEKEGLEREVLKRSTILMKGEMSTLAQGLLKQSFKPKMCYLTYDYLYIEHKNKLECKMDLRNFFVITDLSKNNEYLFKIRLDGLDHLFSTKTENDKNDWIAKLEKVKNEHEKKTAIWDMFPRESQL